MTQSIDDIVGQVQRDVQSHPTFKRAQGAWNDAQRAHRYVAKASDAYSASSGHLYLAHHALRIGARATKHAMRAYWNGDKATARKEWQVAKAKAQTGAQEIKEGLTRRLEASLYTAQAAIVGKNALREARGVLYDLGIIREEKQPAYAAVRTK